MWRKMAGFMRFDGLQPAGRAPRPRPTASPLADFSFAPNPGNLRGFAFVPAGLKAGAPLVVILHGCGQTAQGYDLGAGWCELARELGFAVLAAEQKAANNPGTCFDWFNPEDITRGEGEAASIATMITQMVEQHAIDTARIFITGLSAGGAMTAVMLANYPEMFAGGAIIAGLPFGCAVNVRDALEAMKSAPLKTPRQWGDLVRAASLHDGAWPRVSIWHGAADMTVAINNAQASVAQWCDLHGLSLLDARQEMSPGVIRLSWGDKLECVTIAAMGHGTPIDSSDLGVPAPFMLDVGISSTRRIADFWGLSARPAVKPKPVVVPEPEEPVLPKIEETIAPRVITPVEAEAENLLAKVMRLLRGR